MKKALSLLMVFLVAVMWSAPGFSADKYVSGNIGITWMSDTEGDILGLTDDYIDGELGFSSGIALFGAFGCDYGDYRIEGELGYQNNDVDSFELSTDFDFGDNGEDFDESFDLDGDITILSLLVNGYYDIDLGGGVELSPTVGVGVAQVSMDDVWPSDFDGEDLGVDINETTFAYQAGIGLGIPVADNIMLDARYRYFATTDFTMLVVNTNIESHSALLGLRVGF
ncbi:MULTISPECIES: outer membrane protein [unclassified Prosthecochloris]|uniref:outer membrane protein n=1 Tax=unclassified Prosthecochloris TaxID=2632826 RepID=UPI00223D7A61|nr:MULTISPECIES: outer membrane beta-barrel protein [unclassified Prosthecochloris]UZJ37261.1 outer membrane beta-barrel protein [Prosthecochloris sp. SCSIO W1103]UZJ39073.1 outer membrane beta-barrel protein [Prosthecochloris sp. SCSIO W1102]